MRSMNAPGVALVAVADDVLLPARGLTDRRPLGVRREARAATAAQAALANLFDQLVVA